jgi:hypothetical protein
MRAVNLIPDDSRRGWRGSGRSLRRLGVRAAGHAGVALALVTVVRPDDQPDLRSEGEGRRAAGRGQPSSGAAARLAPYVEFAKLAQARTETVREIASSRFDWHAALAGLSRVVPANTSLSPWSGPSCPARPSAAPAASGASGTDLRGDISGPGLRALRMLGLPGRRRPADLAAAADRRCDASVARGFTEERQRPVRSIGELRVRGRRMPAGLAVVRPGRVLQAARERRRRRCHVAGHRAGQLHHKHRRIAVTGRDRLVVVIVVLVIVAVAGAWILVIQPKRDQANKLGAKVTAAQNQLAAARTQIAAAEADRRAYARNYQAVAELGEAVPSDDDTPSLIFELQNAATRAGVDFRSLVLNARIVVDSRARRRRAARRRPARRSPRRCRQALPSAPPAFRRCPSPSPSRETSSISRTSWVGSSASSSPPTRRSR